MDNVKSIIRGVLISYAVTITFLLLFSLLLVRTNIREQYINIVVIIISAVSILIGTTISTIKIKKLGLINGIIISLIYIVTLYITSSCINKSFSFSSGSFFMMLCAIILGVLGGIIGVNIKS